MTLASTVLQEPTVVLASVSTPPGGYVPPSIEEFFYDPLFGSGIFAVNRIVLMMLLVTGVQFIMLGLLAEMQARTYHESQDKPVYVIRDVLETHRPEGLGPELDFVGVSGNDGTRAG